jgi:hypothetical protein
MEDDATDLARALIAIHGKYALSVAQRAVDNVRQLGRVKQLDDWTRVVAEIKRMQKPGGEGAD